MAYKSYPGPTTNKYTKSSTTTMTTAGGKAWEDLRRDARKLEGEIDVKLAAYGKLASGFEASYKLRTTSTEGSSSIEQISQTKATELESLLQRLSDTNDEMSGLLGGVGDSRSHLLARHRDIMQDYSMEFRRMNVTLGAARDRMELLASSGGGGLQGGGGGGHIALQVQGGAAGGAAGAALRERGMVQSSSNAVDEVLAQAALVSQNLVDQRRLFDNISDKILSVGARFPVVNGILNAIRRKKSKDTMILSAVIACCVLFTLAYIFFK